MLDIIKERYLNKIMSLEKFYKNIRSLLMVDESNLILENNIHEALHDVFVYETLFSDNVGFGFEFKLIKSNPMEKEIFVKIINVDEF